MGLKKDPKKGKKGGTKNDWEKQKSSKTSRFKSSHINNRTKCK